MPVLKRLAAILLLTLLLFNWIGFRVMYDYLQHRADVKLVAKLDRNEFQESELVTIKVPLNLPYQQNWKEFERYDGDVTVDGVHYKYVMRKVENDSLVLKCIPNEQRKRIVKAENRYFQLVNDLQHQGQADSKSKVSVFKNPVSEFYRSQQLALCHPVAEVAMISYSTSHATLASGFSFTDERPPRV